MSDLDWMKEAFKLAKIAEQQGEVPVGAVLVNANNQRIGQGSNQVIQSNDPTAHAEIIAIREGAQYCKNYRLENCTLYVTLEPCSMCAGALIHARVKRLHFATRDFKTGAAGSTLNFFHRHSIQIDEGIMQKECEVLLQTFFKKLRHDPNE